MELSVVIPARNDAPNIAPLRPEIRAALDGALAYEIVYVDAGSRADTAAALKIFRRDVLLDLPLFDHIHRFLPALVQRQGGRVVSVVVNHRPRERGRSNYGTFDRLWVGITDLFGVMWLQRRAKNPEILAENAEEARRAG